jgi:adenylate cyclase
MSMLYAVTNDGQIFNFPISKERVTIGRGKDNDLVFLDSTVSRHHAEILKTEKGYFIVDLGSYNGTRVNGKLIQSARLKLNDRMQVGLNNLTLLDEKARKNHPGDSLVLTTEGDFEKGRQQIVESSPIASYGDSDELLIPFESKRGIVGKGMRETSKGDHFVSNEDVSTLARSNKVLFVLYEISRQLNQIHDFNELLNKMMDLIFMVIDADYGFLVLTGGREGDELIPVVVKHKTEEGKAKHEIKASRTLIDKVIQDGLALLTSNAMTDARLDGAKSLMIHKIRSAMCVPLWRRGKIIGVIQLDSVRFDNQFTQDDLELLKAISTQMAMVIEQSALNEQIREEERMRSRLERFHSPQVIEMILKGGQETKDTIMEPKELIATIIFTDIIGFTRLSEKMPPREVNIILNRYFSRMSDIVFSYDGTLDKYIGDGLMAVFGAPMEKDDDADRAIKAALDMRRHLALMMDHTNKEKRFDIRIGINTGRVVAGNIGSPKRIDYTVIGDPVNIASRLESIAEPNQILIGEGTYRRVEGKFNIRKVGLRKVKGKSAEVMAYEVLD